MQQFASSEKQLPDLRGQTIMRRRSFFCVGRIKDAGAAGTAKTWRSRLKLF
jgi:hypothetical protein